MDTLNAADWVIVTIVGVSTLTSLLRGFIKEAFSLLGWVLAFAISMVFSERLSYLLAQSIENPVGRQVVSFALLFVVTLVAVALLSKLLRTVVEFVGLGGLDRLLGMAFGFARGVLIVLALVVVLRPALDLDQYAWWHSSVMLPHLLLMEGWFRDTSAALRAFIVELGN